MELGQDLVKGTFVPIILALLKERPMYGYEMVKLVNARSKGLLEWKEGTLYPTLHALQARRLVSAQWQESPAGKKRKYYAITPKGLAEMQRRAAQWVEFSTAVSGIILGIDMAGFDELVDQITRRLRLDPELRWDVANELRSHLEDSAGEFLAAGLDEPAAHAEAAKALGDPEQLADQLWLANRTRIRFRQVARWAARVALMPAVILIMVLLAWHVWPDIIGDNLPLEEQIPLSGLLSPNTRELKGLTPEQQFLLTGSPQAPTVLQRYKSISDRWPDNPVYYGAYLSVLLDKDGDLKAPGFRQLGEGEGLSLTNPRDLPAVLAALENGARLDPQNGYYDVIRAYVLAIQSSTRVDVPSTRPGPATFEETSTAPVLPSDQGRGSELTITDFPTFSHAVAAFRAGAAKADIRIPREEFARQRIGLLPKVKTITDLGPRLQLGSYDMFSGSCFRELARVLRAHVNDLARQGRYDEAMALAGEMEEFSVSYGAATQDSINVLVALAVQDIAREAREDVYRALGDQTKAEAIRQLRETRTMAFRARHEGFSNPLARPEALLAEHVLLLTLLAMLILIASACAFASMAGWLKAKHDGQWAWTCLPDLPMVTIIVVAIVTPAGVYALYSRLLVFPWILPALGFETPTLWSPYFVAQAALVIGLTLVVLVIGAYRLLRRRCQRAGISVPNERMKGRRAFLILGVILLIVTVLYLGGWTLAALNKAPIPDDPGQFALRILGMQVPNDAQQDLDKVGYVAAGSVAVLLTAWLIAGVIWLVRLPQKRFTRTIIRSLIPCLLVAAILIGAAGAPTLMKIQEVALRPAAWTGDLTTDEMPEIRSFHGELVRRYVELRGHQPPAERSAASDAMPSSVGK